MSECLKKNKNVLIDVIMTDREEEGYGKNWTHFVYKLDNVFRSIRVSDENSSVTLALHFLKLITTPDFFCVPYAPFKATSSIFHTF